MAEVVGEVVVMVETRECMVRGRGWKCRKGGLSASLPSRAAGGMGEGRWI